MRVIQAVLPIYFEHKKISSAENTESQKNTVTCSFSGTDSVKCKIPSCEQKTCGNSSSDVDKNKHFLFSAKYFSNELV